MEVELAYGETGLSIEVPDGARVVLPNDPPALADPDAAIGGALRPWLPGLRPPVAVVFPDLTRPFPHTAVLPPLLDELHRAGIGADDIVLFCATGTHRQATDAEMRALIGDDLVDRYAVVDHDCSDFAAHTKVGAVDGVPILVESSYVECATRIVTGFVEPHFFAGYSGGPKAVVPGLAALSTVMEAHSPARIASPDATWLHTVGNPVHDFVRAATALAPPTLSLDVTIDADRRLTGVWCAPLPDGHEAACAFVRQTNVTSLPAYADVVVTTNAGYPLDRNLYQAVKGLAAAERAVMAGGTILAAAACADGLPKEGRFGAILAAADDLLAVDSEHDQWQVQVLGRVLRRARVGLHTDGLNDDELRLARMDRIDDISTAIHDLHPESVCVLPRGPLTVVDVR
jgi:lactate racemase